MLMGTEVKSLRAGARLAGRRVRGHRRATRRGCTACTSRSTPRAPGPTTPPGASASCCSTATRSTRSSARSTRRASRSCPLPLYFMDGRAKVEIALAKGKKTWDKRHVAGRAAGQPRDRAGRRPPAEGHGVTDRELGAASEDVAPVRAFWRGARAARALRRARALPAAQHPAAGCGQQFDPAGPEDRPGVADPLPAADEERVELLRDAGRTPLLGAALRAQARRRGVPQRLGARLRRRRARVALVGDVLPRARGAGVRRGAGRRRRRGVQGARAGGGVPPRRPAARRRSGACSRTPARRSWSTPARARSATTSPGRSRCSGCWSGTRGWPWSSRTSARRSTASSCGSPSATSGSASTPRWCSPTSSRPAPTRDELAAAAASTCSPRCCSARDFPTIPYPYAHQLEGLARLDLGDDWLRDVCWHNGHRLFGMRR